MRFFTESDVRRLLPMRDAIALMRSVFTALGRGEAQNQGRRRLTLPTGSVLHALAGAYGAYFGTKIYSTHPKHGAHFLFVLYRAEDALPVAIFEANYLGQIRTGAASGFATDLLARPDARTLTVIGAGFQARSQMEAMLAVRDFRDIRVWSRTAESRETFARECSEEFGRTIVAVAEAESAVRGADVIVTATNAREPVIDASWVAPGAHINAMGSNNPKRSEIPAELVQKAGLIAVDSIEQARMESGDLLRALDEEGWRSPRLVELAELAAGKRSYKRAGEPTLFKSNGLGVEDVAAAGFVYDAEKDGATVPVLYS